MLWSEPPLPRRQENRVLHTMSNRNQLLLVGGGFRWPMHMMRTRELNWRPAGQYTCLLARDDASVAIEEERFKERLQW